MCEPVCGFDAATHRVTAVARTGRFGCRELCFFLLVASEYVKPTAATILARRPPLPRGAARRPPR